MYLILNYNRSCKLKKLTLTNELTEVRFTLTLKFVRQSNNLVVKFVLNRLHASSVTLLYKYKHKLRYMMRTPDILDVVNVRALCFV